MRIGPWSRLSPHLWTLALALALVTRSVPAQAQGSQAVDLELALLVDVSASVNDKEYRLQVGGLATAFRSTAVLDAIRSSAHRGIAVSVIQWANQANQRVSVGWTLVRGEADALWLAARIASMPRLIHGGHTALGNALVFGMLELESNRFTGPRRVIDLSGDGRSNDGRPLRAVREEVIKHGITINGLAILNELPLLDHYFRDHLIGGEGAFFMVAQDYTDFAQAMIHKLVREIRSVPLSENEVPNLLYKARAELFPAAFRTREKFRVGTRSDTYPASLMSGMGQAIEHGRGPKGRLGVMASLLRHTADTSVIWP